MPVQRRNYIIIVPFISKTVSMSVAFLLFSLRSEKYFPLGIHYIISSRSRFVNRFMIFRASGHSSVLLTKKHIDDIMMSRHVSSLQARSGQLCKLLRPVIICVISDLQYAKAERRALEIGAQYVIAVGRRIHPRLEYFLGRLEHIFSVGYIFSADRVVEAFFLECGAELCAVRTRMRII